MEDPGQGETPLQWDKAMQPMHDEEAFIITKPELATLNKRNELKFLHAGTDESSSADLVN